MISVNEVSAGRSALNSLQGNTRCPDGASSSWNESDPGGNDWSTLLSPGPQNAMGIGSSAYMWSLRAGKESGTSGRFGGNSEESITIETCPGYGGLYDRGKYIGLADRAEDLAFSMIGEETGGFTLGCGSGGSVGS